MLCDDASDEPPVMLGPKYRWSGGLLAGPPPPPRRPPRLLDRLDLVDDAVAGSPRYGSL